MLLVQQRRHLQRQRLEEGVDETGSVAQKLPLKYILLSDHEPSDHDGKNAAVVHPVETVRYIHADADHQNEEDHELLEGHEGSQRHYSHAVGRQHVDRAHEERVRRHSQQGGQLEYLLSFRRLAEEDDNESLQEKDLNDAKSTVE